MDAKRVSPSKRRLSGSDTPDSSSDESATTAAPPPSKKTKTFATEIDASKVTKLTKKRSSRERLVEFRRHVNNIVVFHTAKEVEDNLSLIMEDTINRIANKIGFGWYLKLVPLPREEIIEVFKRIVFENVQEPLRDVIRTHPKQAKRMVDLSSSVPKDESLIPEIDKIIAAEEKENTDPSSSFSSMLDGLEEVRYNLVKKIVSELFSDKMWPSINPVRKITNKDLLADIGRTVFTAICPFARDFSRFFVDDEEGFNGELNEVLEIYGFD